MIDPRKLAEDTLRQWGTTGNIPLNSETLARELLEALDERDRLRSDFDLRDADRGILADAWRKERDARKAAEAERDRLREALERIANAGCGIPDWRSMSDCARAALRELKS
jgi:hypothetical protein